MNENYVTITSSERAENFLATLESLGNKAFPTDGAEIGFSFSEANESLMWGVYDFLRDYASSVDNVDNDADTVNRINLCHLTDEELLSLGFFGNFFYLFTFDVHGLCDELLPGMSASASDTFRNEIFSFVFSSDARKRMFVDLLLTIAKERKALIFPESDDFEVLTWRNAMRRSYDSSAHNETTRAQAQEIAKFLAASFCDFLSTAASMYTNVNNASSDNVSTLNSSQLALAANIQSCEFVDFREMIPLRSYFGGGEMDFKKASISYICLHYALSGESFSSQDI